MDDLVAWIIEPLSYPFMVRGLAAVTMVGIVCAVVGTYVILRGMAFFGDALAHAVLPGVAIGYLVSGGARGSVFWWALATALLVALGIGAVGARTQIKQDTAIGVIFAGMFALGIALISTVRSYAVDLAHFLFGDVLGVSTGDLWLTGVFGALVLVTIAALYKELLVLSFDSVLAATLRMPATVLNNLLLVMLAVTTVVSLQTVGVTLVVAMLVTPAATAYLLMRRFVPVMVVGAALGIAAAVAGLYLSYYLNIPSGAAMTLVATSVFAVVAAAKRRVA